MARSYPAIKTVPVYPGAVDTNIMYHWRKKYLTSDRLMRLTTTFLNKLYRRMGREVFTVLQVATSVGKTGWPKKSVDDK